MSIPVRTEPRISIEQANLQNLNKMAVELLFTDAGDVLEICEKILLIAMPEASAPPKYPAEAAECLQTLGRFYSTRSEYGTALEFFTQSFMQFEGLGMRREIALSRSYIGVTFMSMGDYSRAAELLKQSMNEAEAVGDESLVAEILNDLCYTYVSTGDPRLALEQLPRGIELFRRNGDEMRLSWALDTMAYALLQVGRKEEALECELEGMRISLKNEMWRDVARFRQSVGKMYLLMGDPESAAQVFQELLDQSEQMNVRGDIGIALLSLAQIDYTKASLSDALERLNRALFIFQQLKLLPNLSECYELLSKVYKSTGEYEKALEMHERFHETDKTLFNSEADKRLKNIEVIYQLDVARKEADLHQKHAQRLQKEVDERRMAQAELEVLARTDSLTGILNRRAFFETAEKIVQTICSTTEPLAIILVDVDHFKQINDQYGHQNGDRALMLVADRLRSRVRANDLLGRYGGEEFIVLQVGVSPNQAMETAERLRTAICDSALQVGDQSVQVALSLGVATCRPGMEHISLDKLIACADQALYRAKDCGRNCAILSTCLD